MSKLQYQLFQYQSRVGENGLKLSGGQKQRIGIARALYKNPEIIILDEATSSLDLDTEKKLIDTIQNIKHGKTIIIISHRLSTLKICDQILKIKVKNLNIHNILATLTLLKVLNLNFFESASRFLNLQPSEGRGKIYNIKIFCKYLECLR